MAGSPVKIGPFVNGLNTVNEPSTIADTEASELLNFDVDLDGSIASRPPVTVITGAAAGGSKFIGMFVSGSGTVYFIYAVGTTCRAYDVAGNSWTTIASNIDISNCVQYQNKLWLIASIGSASNGGSWEPVGGFVTVAAMPRGVFGCIYKERLFIATGVGSTNPSRINFSGPANFTSWAGTDFFDVANGDGQAIYRIHSWSGQIAVFKQNSTYTFGYDTMPAKGVTSLQSSTIGIAGTWALAEAENILYVLWGNSLYAIVNWNWDQINIKVPFAYYSYKVKATWQDYSISIVNNRLIVRFFDNFYVYGLKTKAFSMWRFNTASYTPDAFVRYPYIDVLTGKTFYVAANYDKSGTTLYKLVDDLQTGNQETFICSLVTKTYDFEVPYTFKRLFHWGVDLFSKSVVEFSVIPTAYNVPIKWSELKTLKWSQLKTWAKPLDVSLNVTDSISGANPSNTRIYVKLLKSLRFRQLAFRLSSTVTGSNTTGPLRVFSITAFVSNKELVSKKVS